MPTCRLQRPTGPPCCGPRRYGDGLRHCHGGLRGHKSGRLRPRPRRAGPILRAGRPRWHRRPRPGQGTERSLCRRGGGSLPSARAAWLNPALRPMSSARNFLHYYNGDTPMRMRFKPYARPELLACDFHVHGAADPGGHWHEDPRPPRTSPGTWSWAVARAVSWRSWPLSTRTSTTWASTSPTRC